MDDRLNLRLESELYNKIKINAKKLGVSISGYIRMAIIEKLTKDNDDFTKFFETLKRS